MKSSEKPLRRSGLPLAAVNPARAFAAAALEVHDEARNPDGTEVWSVYASFNSLSVDSTQRLLAKVAGDGLPRYHEHRPV